MPKSIHPFLSVIVPVYKKEKTILRNLQQIITELEKTPYSFELIPVVDGSKSDGSVQEIKKLRDKRIKLLSYQENRGKGFAIRYGMRSAVGEVVTFIDSGMDIDPQSLVMLLEHMKWYEADIIVGSKLHSASLVSYPNWRKVLTYLYYLFVKIFFGLKIRDTQTGLKAYKSQVLKKVLPRLLVKQFAFDIEILAVANHLGFKKIYDAPVKVNLDFAETTINFFGKNGVLFILIDTLAIWYRLNILKYYDRGYKKSRKYDDVLEMYVNTP